MRAARRAVQGAVLVLSVLLGLLFAVPGGSAAATYRVAMSGYAYRPATLTIPAGATVTWTNQDTAPHDVKTTSAPAAFHSPLLNQGGSWSFTFTMPGTYAYYCTVHPNMTARIVVEAAAPQTSAAAPTTHEHARSGTSPEHRATTPSRPAPTRSPTSSPARSTSPASAPAAAHPASPSPAPTPAAEPQPQATASTLRPLDPLLLLTGIVAGVAVLCLLLVGSRASRGREEEA
ncbi:plastocyanin/azurin family copper-binding protein [Streptomyces sp. NPDC049627]|uniref:cupredoxin domain-containing protein n=1 Tax=Streptomyces sp. NPDC049627 TaxID=3365595 RepID=UPI0037B2DB67